MNKHSPFLLKWLKRAKINQEWSFDSDVLFLIDYFGYTGSPPDLSGYKGIVIRDVTHSLLSNSYKDADYYFGSLRKWAGFWTGGFAWGIQPCALPENVPYAHLRKTAMEQKQQYIAGETGCKGYLSIFSEAEEVLEQYAPAGASARDVQLAQTMDVAFIKKRRQANAKVLLDAFSDMAVFPNPVEKDCPMFVPILVPDGKRDALRRYLIENAIYCPVHWPISAYHVLDERTETLYENSLSLVCDQRYTETDMLRMVETIKKFWKE